ncbi:MAG: Crp/Fnr family transcriptional regulator [Chitinophagaceae bacterium]|nr:MAG: Crp/Fnr family transcriptional regulator [Chitinophagaceae bacterium]
MSAIPVSLQQYLSQLSPHADANMALSQFFETLNYEKNEVIFARGKIAHKILFLESGSVLSSRPFGNTLITHRFWTCGQMIFPAESMFTNSPLLYSCTAIEPTTSTAISYSSIREFISQHPDGWDVIAKFFSTDLAFWQDRLKSLTDLTPMARYNKFVSEYPQINRLAKSEFIASYLNMSYATLARVRRSS